MGARDTGRLPAFLRDERGAATIELVIWIPFFFALFLFVVDLSVLFFSYARMWNVTRDAARDISIGLVAPTTAGLQAEVDAKLGSIFTGRVSADGAIYTVVVESPTDLMSPFGFLKPVADNMIATVVISSEPTI
ncbi:MAG: TadE/TadG family type IV pilus assembly protein [Pseudomonadota bacterium]